MSLEGRKNSITFGKKTNAEKGYENPESASPEKMRVTRLAVLSGWGSPEIKKALLEAEKIIMGSASARHKEDSELIEHACRELLAVLHADPKNTDFEKEDIFAYFRKKYEFSSQ